MLQLLLMTNDVVNNMQFGLEISVCVLDLSTTFDKVGHNRLVEKLRWYTCSIESGVDCIMRQMFVIFMLAVIELTVTFLYILDIQQIQT